METKEDAKALNRLLSGVVSRARWQAWLSNYQVWGEEEAKLKLVEAAGATMKLHSGQYAGSDVTFGTWGLISPWMVQRGESRWNVGEVPSQNVWQTGEELDHTVFSLKVDPWGTEQAMDWDVSWTHIEEWDSSKGTRDFLVTKHQQWVIKAF